jgi:Protein of unknown function (DUF3445)
MELVKKSHRHARGNKACRTLPGAEACAREVCEEIASYLSVRYPNLFRIERVLDGVEGDKKVPAGGGDSFSGQQVGRVKTVELLSTGEKWDLARDDPMLVAGLLQMDDLAIMVEG